MGYSSALILLLSLASQSWAYPVAQAGLPATTHTYDDGFYHWKATTATPVAAAATFGPSVSVVTVFTTVTYVPSNLPVPDPSSTAAAAATTARVEAAAATTIAQVETAAPPTIAQVETAAQPTIAQVEAAAASGSAATGTVPATTVAYKKYTGDGSSAAGWPTQDDWASFEQMWANNKPIMAVSCSSQNVEDNTEAEMAQIRAAILKQASATKVDARFILATIMEESTGCVRVKTTASPGDGVINPGLMQDHQGAGSCAGMAAPCPESQINQMIQDGTAGTASGDGLQQTLQKAAAFGKDATAVYVAARIYNSGSYHGGALEANAATACYASDIANLLRGFAGAQSPCKLGTA